MNRGSSEDEWDQAQDWKLVADGSSPDEPRDGWGVDDTAEDASTPDADPAIVPRRLQPRRLFTIVFVVVGALIVVAAVGVTVGWGRSGPEAAPSHSGPPAQGGVAMASYPPIEPVPEPSGTPAASAAASAPTQATTPPPVRNSTPPGRNTQTPRTTVTAPAAKPSGKATTAAAPAYTAPRAGVTVRLVSLASGKSAGVSLGSGADGARVAQSADLTNTAQHWRIVAAQSGCFHLVNVRSGKALDNTDGTSVNGMQMQQWTNYDENTNQTWCFQGVGAERYSIRNMTSGFLLDVRDGGTADGVAIQQWNADPASPNANQTWRIVLVS
ncbi:RICIN domain-containing protein [Dactylosporangium sp. AC04546]|uniref:RICIN domain-containing protein n=1 Tax=Dactylosporangium sp. AC04546 TaxID=2862460 RepID=UPI001EDDB267|nr:RICIN domain-containing protein [Dactylosporangium sp. AC04546]WVK86723.1 RICIN domain-containing protein [Dactylosporangium sp. AC04546]